MFSLRFSSGLSLLAAVLTGVAPCAGLANPQGGVVAAGQAEIGSAGSALTVTQRTDKAIIDWRGFDIGVGEVTTFNQPSSSSLTLNRVNSASASLIEGTLKANGNLVIVNPNGVLFGKGSRVDVNGLVATTANIDNARFMAGDLRFDKPGNPDAVIENQGTITAGEAGLVGLVAPKVLNSGTITAKLGRIALASGDAATVDFYGDGLLEIKASPALQAQLIDTTGRLAAEGGTITLTAAAAGEVVNSLIHVGGELNAASVGAKQGTIEVYAEGSNAVKGNVAVDKGTKAGASTVLVDGTLNASGRKAGERGGKITVTGDNVAVLDGAVIDASGHTGMSWTTGGKVISAVREGSAGGDIRIGGDYLGGGTTPTAKNLYVSPWSVVLNDALSVGDAGRTIFWADGTTRFYGNVYARALGGEAVDALSWNASAGGNAGDGGFVETSGHGFLDAQGYVDLTASNGRRGTYFLDPTDITIYGNVDPAFVSTDGTINLATNLKLWLDASDTSKVVLTYNGLGTTATGTLGNTTLTVSANTGLVVGARIRLGGAGAVTAASTVGADTYTVTNIAGTTITLSSALTTTYTGSAVYQGYVSQLTDKSGQGHNMTPIVSGPLYLSERLNGLSVLDFNGTNENLTSSSFTLNTPISLFFTYRRTGLGSAGAGSLAIFDGINNNTYNVVYPSGANPSSMGLYPQDWNSGNAISVPELTSKTWFTYTTTGDGTSGIQYINGGESSHSFGGYTGSLGGVRLFAGDGNGEIPQGQMSEIIVYGSKVSTTSRNLVEQYQSAKWGIGLTPPGTGAGEVAKCLVPISSGEGLSEKGVGDLATLRGFSHRVRGTSRP